MDIAVIGLGLIGGSVLQALARHGHRVIGYDADPTTRALARARAAATVPGWRVADTLPDAVNGARLAILAVPLPALAPVLDELVAAGFNGLVTDVTSVKTPVDDLIARVRPHRYVGGHPMAGREVSGFQAADPDLFANCAWVLCVEPRETVLADWLDIADLITRLGARVVPSTAAEHDRAVATISHVPHLLAVALAAAMADNPLAGTLAAGSFRDGTRVAASPPDLIAAMCGGNAAAVVPALDQVQAALEQAGDALRKPDPISTLRPWLAAGCTARANWPAPPGQPVELPAEAATLLGLGRAGGWVTAVAADRRTVTALYRG